MATTSAGKKPRGKRGKRGPPIHVAFPPATPSLKVVLIGDGAVGKTSTILTYTTGTFPEFYPCVIDNYRARAMIDGMVLDVDIVDSLGQSDLTTDFERERYRGADVFIVLFSLISPTSFDHVREIWIPEITAHCPGVPIVLGGTKKDLLGDETILARLNGRGWTPVTEEQARALSNEIGAEGYVPYSSLTQGNMKRLFDLAYEVGLEAQDKRRKSNRRWWCCWK